MAPLPFPFPFPFPALELEPADMAELGKTAVEAGLGPLTVAKDVGVKGIIQNVFAKQGFGNFMMVANTWALSVLWPVIKQFIGWVFSKAMELAGGPSSKGPSKLSSSKQWEEQPYADYSAPVVVGNVVARGADGGGLGPEIGPLGDVGDIRNIQDLSTPEGLPEEDVDEMVRKTLAAYFENKEEVERVAGEKQEKGDDSAITLAKIAARHADGEALGPEIGPLGDVGDIRDIEDMSTVEGLSDAEIEAMFSKLMKVVDDGKKSE